MMALHRFSLVAVCAFLAAFTGACGSSNSTPAATAPTGSACSFSITQPTTTFSAAGGTGSVPVTATSGCTWTATSNAAFVTITAGGSGSGNGTVAFAVAANTGTDRTATLTIAGSTVSIAQSGASAAPTGTLGAPTANAPVGGVFVTPGTPTLIVNNAAATGAVGTVTYRFEVSDTGTFPVDPARTFTQDGVAQGSGTTGWVVNHNLGANVLWYWHARATNGTVTTAYSATDTFSTGSPCGLTVSPVNTTAAGGGGTATITVTGGSTCAWTAVSNAAFITVAGGASGSGNGTVTYVVATNSTTAVRSGTLTVAGQTVTIIQSAGGGLVASFQLFDPATQAAATTECRLRNSNTPPQPTTCTLQSTSFAAGTNSIVSYAWSVQYTYDVIKTVTGTTPTLAITDMCGGFSSTSDGVAQPLAVTLTVTDNLGATATAVAGTGSQPALAIRLFACGS